MSRGPNRRGRPSRPARHDRASARDEAQLLQRGVREVTESVGPSMKKSDHVQLREDGADAHRADRLVHLEDGQTVAQSEALERLGLGTPPFLRLLLLDGQRRGQLTASPNVVAPASTHFHFHVAALLRSARRDRAVGPAAGIFRDGSLASSRV